MTCVPCQIEKKSICILRKRPLRTVPFPHGGRPITGSSYRNGNPGLKTLGEADKQLSCQRWWFGSIVINQTDTWTQQGKCLLIIGWGLQKYTGVAMATPERPCTVRVMWSSFICNLKKMFQFLGVIGSQILSATNEGDRAGSIADIHTTY